MIFANISGVYGKYGKKTDFLELFKRMSELYKKIQNFKSRGTSSYAYDFLSIQIGLNLLDTFFGVILQILILFLFSLRILKKVG